MWSGLNGPIAAVSTASATQLVVTVPNGASSGRITVATAGGSATSAIDFAVATFTALRTEATFRAAF